MTMVVLKQLNPRRRHRRGRGNLVSSSFPRNSARNKDQKHTIKKEKETKTKPKANCKLTQKIQNKKNYMMHEQIK